MITIKFKDTMTGGALLLASCILLLASCSKVTDYDEDYVPQHAQANSGAPVIKGIYAVADADQQKVLNEIVAGQRIAIAGENLNNLTSLKFNDVDADLNQTYTILTKAIVKVPDNYTNGDNNTITYTTPQGTTTYRIVPPVVVYRFDLAQAVQQLTDKNVSVETSQPGETCLHFQGVITEWSWVELSFARPVSDVLPKENMSDYNFVFEVKNADSKPLLGRGYEFAFNWNWNSSYRWRPGNGEGLDTKGQWVKVRCPLEEMVPNGFTGTDIVLNIGFQPYRDYDADFRLANFRIEKK